MKIEIWSDIACPWCYVGKKRLEAAVSELGIELHVEWHSFQLDPRPRNADDRRDYAQRLADKYRMPRSQAERMLEQMTRTGGELGIQFDFARAVWANTFDAHRLLHLAKGAAMGTQSALKRALFEAHFCKGQDVGDHATLAALAVRVGLPIDVAAAVLASDDFSDAVRSDVEAARDLGVRGVPFFVIGKYGIGGAQQPETFLRVLERALDDAEEARDQGDQGDQGDSTECGPEGHCLGSGPHGTR